jgi:hypothetical protein
MLPAVMRDWCKAGEPRNLLVVALAERKHLDDRGDDSKAADAGDRDQDLGASKRLDPLALDRRYVSH